MSSANKQQKRAKRAKTKAKQLRVSRQNPQIPTPIVPDYFMPDFLAPEDEAVEDLLMQTYLEPDILESLDDDERAALKALMAGDDEDMPTEDEMLLWEVFDHAAPPPTEEQRLAHFEHLKEAEQEGEHALLLAFARGPVAAHALYDIDFDDYEDILLETLGAYWMWAHGLDERSVRARIDSDAFYQALRAALREIEEESTARLLSAHGKKNDEPARD